MRHSLSFPVLARLTLAAAAAALLLPATAAAQERREDLPVDAALADSVARAAADAVARGYVFPAKADAAARLLRRGIASGRYRGLATASALTDSLTADLRRAVGDRHLQVAYSVEPRGAAPGQGLTAQEQERDREEAAWRNHGFMELMRMDGNVGYLELARFADPEQAGATLAAAMGFLAGTDALIIDLRQNGGGRASMVALIASYFFREQTLLTTLHHRDPADLTQIWTTPHVAGPRYLDRPVYILVSGRTFSAAEGLAYDLQAHHLATVVGEQTRGGANPGGWQMIGSHFAVAVPTAWNENAVTHGNWEGVGIKPDMAVPARDALRVAHRAALDALQAAHPESTRAAWWREARAMLAADDAQAAAAAAAPAR